MDCRKHWYHLFPMPVPGIALVFFSAVERFLSMHSFRGALMQGWGIIKAVSSDQCLTPTTPIQDPPTLLPSLGKRKQRPQQQVPATSTPTVLMPLLSNGAGHHQQ